MALFLLILQLVTAIPSVIKVIKEIMDIIHNLKGPEKEVAEKRLHSLISYHEHKCAHQRGDHNRCREDLENLLKDFRKGQFAAPEKTTSRGPQA